MTDLDRRTVLRGAGAVGVTAVAAPVLAACGGSSGASAAGDGAAGEPVVVATSAVPVSGGAIQDKVVVTQPAAGEFKAFSAICPHQGCSVTSVADDVISCPCHGSTFSAMDGAKLSGPATRGLTVLTATVDGDTVLVT